MRSSRDGRAASRCPSPVTVRDQVEMVEPGRCSWSCFIQPLYPSYRLGCTDARDTRGVGQGPCPQGAHSVCEHVYEPVITVQCGAVVTDGPRRRS